jgi:hypothetical protein
MLAMKHGIKLYLTAILLALIAAAAFSFFLFHLPEESRRTPAVLYSGGAFHLHKEIGLLVTSPSGLSMLNDVQVSNLLLNYELVLPTGLRLDNESVGIFSTTRGALLDVDGMLRISPDVPPGTKTIKLRLPGIMNQASNLGTKVTLQTNVENADGPYVWIVCRFEVVSNSAALGNDPAH